MSRRNSLFRRAKQLLEKDGIPAKMATETAYNSLREVGREQTRKYGCPGSQPSVMPVLIVEELCNGSLPNCTGESNNPFRRINGTCNNLGGNTSEGLELQSRGKAMETVALRVIKIDDGDLTRISHLNTSLYSDNELHIKLSPK